MLTADSNGPRDDAARPDRTRDVSRPMPRPPGALLSSAAWMAAPMFELARRNPRLAVTMLGLDRAQLHLLAFALAHLDPMTSDVSDLVDRLGPGTIAAARGESVRAVLGAMGMGEVMGLGRVLRRLPEEVLLERDYQHITRLLADPLTAEMLNHAAVIDKWRLRNMAELPPALRTMPVVVALGDTPGGARVLPDWLDLVAERRGNRDCAYVTNQLVAARSSRALRACIVRLSEELPLPDGLPPAVIGAARRLDTPAEIRRVAQRFGNCLRHRVDEVDAATSLFYLWRADDNPVVCELRRGNRLGWALCEHLGPRNATPDAGTTRRIEADFRRAGVRPLPVAAFADTMIANLETADRRAPCARLRDDDDEEDGLAGLRRRRALRMPPF